MSLHVRMGADPLWPLGEDKGQSARTHISNFLDLKSIQDIMVKFFQFSKIYQGTFLYMYVKRFVA